MKSTPLVLPREMVPYKWHDLNALVVDWHRTLNRAPARLEWTVLGLYPFDHNVVQRLIDDGPQVAVKRHYRAVWRESIL